MHVGWSNLPLRPIFLPLVTRLTFDLAGAEQAGRDLIAGQPLVLPLSRQPRPAEVEVTRPGGETLRLPAETSRNRLPRPGAGVPLRRHPRDRRLCAAADGG